MNKIIIASLAIVLTISINAQGQKSNSIKEKGIVTPINLNQIKEIDTTISLKERFDFISEEIKNTRIVALGEQSHTPDLSFKIRADLIEYLIEYHDFDLILFESGIFDIQLASMKLKQSNSINDLQNGLYGFWGHIPQHDRLFEYLQTTLDTNKGVEFGGFDHKVTSKPVGTTDIYSKTLSELLLNIKADPNSEEYKAYINTWKAIEENRKKGGLNRLVFPMTESEKLRFNELSVYFQNKLSKANNKVWLHIVKGFDQGILLYSDVTMEKMQSDPEFVLKLNNTRDVLMADNLKFLLSEVYKDKKVILIGATYHFARNVDKVTPSNVMGVDFSKSYTTGELISKNYSENIFTIGFLAPENYNCENSNALGCLQNIAGYNIAYHPLHKWNLKVEETSKQQIIKLFMPQSPSKHPNWNDVLDAVVLINNNK